ncbi:MAG: hypothetical protein KKC39_00960 [Candidatus Omnitrophica bacterium]|nr:hypothetical protein [Candidatus Omnitrophota bacterium]
MESKYIELNRSFAPVPKECIFEEDEYDLGRFWGLSITKKWEDLLSLYRVVILAEAGAGKTEEMKAITQRLCGEQKAAFFLRLEHLCSEFKISFDIGSPGQFSSWLLSKEEGWFFLDSVDEARLKGPHQFEEAIRKFANELGGNIERAHIYIASRVSEWRSKADLEFIAGKLPLREINRSNQEQEGGGVKNQSHPLSRGSFSKSENNIEPSIFVLCPLDENQILNFSRALGVSDPDNFLSEIHRKEADNYAKRPLDLGELISFWKMHGNIGNYKTMLEESISFRLQERDPDRESACPLNLEEARYGAEMLAAAVTFQKNNRILIPDNDMEVNSEMINPKEVLCDWDNNKTRALLQRPIFDGAIYGTVRFHHRSVREYLTAQWLYRLLKVGKSRRTIEALFFTERYGERVLTPSMRPILAWLLLYDDEVREKAVKIAPEVLIQGGDPSSLSLIVRKNVLENYCKGYAHSKNSPSMFDLAELRRFSDPDLSSTIKQLILSYRENERLCQLLLEMIWQGDISECSEEVLVFALDKSRNKNTRIYAIRALQAIGSTEQKERFIKFFLPELAISKNGDLIGELINAFSSSVLKVSDILLLLKLIVMDVEERHLNTALYHGLKEVIKDKWSVSKVAEFIDGAVLLLTEPPVIERRYFEISSCYCWLMPFVILAVEKLIKVKDRNAFNENSLLIVSFAAEERNFVKYFHTEEHSLVKLVPQWSELNRTLFWFDVSFLRKQLEKEGKRLNDSWTFKIRGHYWNLTIEDFDYFIEAVKIKPIIDDRLIALSEAFEIYKSNGRIKANRKKLKDAVRGAKELEEKLGNLFHPQPMSIEVKKLRQSNRNFEKRQLARQKKEADNRQEWREWLQKHSAMLRDTSIASSGKVWKATNYLLYEVLNKQNNHNQWARADWEVIIPEFGRDVAEAYRDGCIDYWRKYCPKIQSENKEEQQNTPVAVIIGLSGLMMEAQTIPDWSKNLSKDEANLACRYAMEELNGFPIWLQSLYEVFPNIVEERILAEIEWEFNRPKSDSPSYYVLDDVNWQADWLKSKISQRILKFLEKYEPHHDDTVKKALEIVLADVKLDKKSFTSLVKTKIEKQISNERKIIWLAAWMGIESELAFDELKKLLASISDSKTATTTAMIFLTELLGTRRERVSRVYCDYKKPSMLFSLYKLMHIYIKREDDIIQKGCYSPGLRDDSQDARERLLDFLKEIPGKETYLAFFELANGQANDNMRDWYAGLAHRRAELDAELKTWRSLDVKTFAQDAENNPATHRELFDLIVSRLFDLKEEFENGSMSNAVAFQKIKDERNHRIYIGSYLRDKNSGRYSVSSENELADATRPDLYVFSNVVLGEVPIELKIADKWTVKELEEGLTNQLCGQYLRDTHSTCGIYLLVYLGDKTYWEQPITYQQLNFDQLTKILEDIADKVVREDPKIESIKIISIDLTKRMRSSEASS